LNRGAVISPLLANLYLHPLDLLMEESGRRWCGTPMTL
jgi:RNA-directed DNA polymerase